MTPTFRASTALAQIGPETGTSLIPSQPSATQVGDLLLINVMLDGTAAVAMAMSGATLIAQITGSFSISAVFWTTATAAGTHTLSPVTWGGASRANGWAVAAITAGTFNASLPINASSTSVNTTTGSAAFKFAAVTTTVAGCLDVLMGGIDAADTVAAPTGYTMKQGNDNGAVIFVGNSAMANGSNAQVTTGSGDATQAIRVAVAPPAAGSTGTATAKTWSGSAWVKHPLKTWSGSSWVQAVSVGPVTAGGGGTGAATFFPSTDVFNTPISASPTIDANSASWISMLAGTAEQGLSVTNVWGYPIFYAQSSDPLKTNVHATTYDTGTAYSFHLPANAAPNTGSDGHMVIVEPDGHTCHDFYVASISGGTLTAQGITAYDCGTASGSSILTVGHLYGSRAAGLALLGGAILGTDYTSGVIPHALSFACTVNANSFRAPAVHTDGTVSGGLPQGARIQLNPTFNISTLPSWMQMIALAAQVYGMIDVDSGSGGIQLFGESTATAGNIYPSQWSTAGNLAAFPWASCRVLANSVNP